MIVKNLNFGSDAREEVFKGITKLTQAVSSTLGASGKCVLLEDAQGNPVITKDGVTVANSIVLLDPVENMGATLLKEAARKTVQQAGDGTTTATILAHAILEEAYKVINKTNSRSLKQEINSAVEKVVKYLESISVSVEGDMIDNIATISTNNDIVFGDVTTSGYGLHNIGSHYNTSDGKFTAPVTGIYFFSAWNYTGSTSAFYLRINGTTFGEYTWDDTGGCGTWVCPMTANQYAQIYTRYTWRGTPDYHNAFCGYLIG